MQKSSEKIITLPLVVAVTGHRNLVDVELESIRARIKNLLLELRESYPANPLMLMSALAEGADMLAAEVAIELKIDLIVPLPKPLESYLLDFRSDHSRQQFQTLCSQAKQVFELANGKPPAPEGVDAAKWENDYPYAHLGTYLSAHCHVLLALWDGKPSSHLGGTAQVVKFHHDKVMPGITPNTVATQQMLVDDESDLVFHIVCSRNRRDSEPHPDHVPLDWCWYTKDEDQPRSKKLPAQHELIFQRSAEFGVDARKFSAQIATEKSSLIVENTETEFPDGVDLVDQLYSAADWLAIHYQRKTLRTLFVTHMMAFLMGLMFILYSDMESWRYLLLAFLGFFVVAVGAHSLAKRGSWQRKYLDYRTLAEGLRVQFYWAVAGVTDEDRWKFAHDSYLQSQNPEFGWIRNVMRVAGIRCDACPNRDPMGVAFTVREWVGAPDRGQLGYFKRRARERIKRHELTEKLGRLSLFVSVLTVFIFIFAGSQMTESVRIFFTVIMGATLLLYGVREGYAYATATKELIKQYEFMLRIFDNAHRRLSQTQSAEELRQILSALGKSALDEHSDWILMHRERSLDESEIWRMGS